MRVLSRRDSTENKLYKVAAKLGRANLGDSASHLDINAGLFILFDVSRVLSVKN